MKTTASSTAESLVIVAQLDVHSHVHNAAQNTAQTSLSGLEQDSSKARVSQLSYVLLLGAKYAVIEIRPPRGAGLRKTRKRLSLIDARKALLLLETARVPVLPECALGFDENEYSLTLTRGRSRASFHWWTIAPAGYEALADFSAWLIAQAKPINAGA